MTDDFQDNDTVPAILRQGPKGNIQSLQVVPGLSDKELAEEIREKVLGKIQPLLDEMSLAKKQGFDVLLGIQTDAQGKSFLQNLKIVKEF